MLMTNILSRVIAGVFTLVLLAGARLYFSYYMLSHVRSMQTETAYHTRHQRPTDIPRPPSFPDHSGWVVFNSSDPVTGAITRHAKLSAASEGAADGTAAPASTLDVTAEKTSGNHVFLTLPGITSCAKLTTIDAAFDKHPATQIDVKPGNGPACVAEIADANSFVSSLRDADTLVVKSGDMPAVTFAVAGLTWD